MILQKIFCKLTVVEIVVISSFLEELVMSALFNNVAVFHNEDIVGVFDC